MEYNLSILIPTLESRKLQLHGLLEHLYEQKDDSIQLLPFLDDGTMTIGFKRNWLLDACSGEYMAFIDDDDHVSDDYIKTLLEGIKTGVDAISLRGQIRIDGGEPEIFEHSIKYDRWITTENKIKYERYTNHLNCIKSSIGKQMTFLENNFGEDHDYSNQLKASGLIKTEYYTDKILYFYDYKSNK